MAKKRAYLIVYAIVAVYIYKFFNGRVQSKSDDKSRGKASRLLRVQNSPVYIYSAVAVFFEHTFEAAENAKQNATFNAIAISAFEIGNDNLLTFKCCFMLIDGTVASTLSSLKQGFPPRAIRNGVQFICPLINDISYIRNIYLTCRNATCPVHEEYYKEVMIPKKPVKKSKSEKTIAVCAKLSYGDLDAGRLVEWIETLKIFGVGIIFSHFYMLNSPARKVFQYYEREGFAEVMELDFPNKEIPPMTNTNSRQVWNDEQVALFNCESRLVMYDYVLVLDTDEFLVPKGNVFKNGWQNLFDEIFLNPEVASAYFWTALHITTWGPTYPEHPLFIGKYNNCTVPMVDREKFVYIPTKNELGSHFTHFNTPFKGYKRQGVDPNKALVHHYRACRGDWLKPRATKHSNRRDWIEGRIKKLMEKVNDTYFFNMETEIYCYDFRRFYSEEMQKVTDAIKSNVRKVLNSVRKE